jgi:hypothetical protein
MQQLLEAADQAQRAGDLESVERYVEIVFAMMDETFRPQYPTILGAASSLTR